MQKFKDTNLQRYGEICSSKNVLVKAKSKETCQAKYGCNNPMQNKGINDKAKATLESHYGVSVPLHNDSLKNKVRETCQSKYGCSNPMQNDDIKAKLKARYSTKNLSAKECVKPKKKFTPKIIHSKILAKEVSKEPIDYALRKDQLENTFIEFVESLYGNITRNCKTILSNHLELDLYIPEKHLAFEFDGVYWYSECQKKDKNYHLSKTLECTDKGIHLIHIFENEWITKRPIVESRVRNLLGLCSDRIFARKCTIKEVDPAISIQFQTTNHLQGAVRTSYNIGLYYKDELVSLMTFGKPRFNNRYEWELLRFCNKLNTSVVGGASKLLRYFEKTYNPKSLISYADRRWSNGNVYYALGFDYDHASESNYWYWKNSSDVLYNRITFQKYKLPQLLEHFNPNLTEVENMYANGYNRIFDCGNLVFVKLYRKDADD